MKFDIGVTCSQNTDIKYEYINIRKDWKTKERYVQIYIYMFT